MAKDNVTLLEEADVLDSRTLSQADKDKINALEDSEVQTLKSVRQKVGRYEPGRPGGTPWFL